MPWKLRKKPPHNVKAFYFQNFSVFATALTSVLKGGNVAGSFFRTNFRYLLEYASPLRNTANDTHTTNCQNKRQVVVALVKDTKPLEPLHYIVK